MADFLSILLSGLAGRDLEAGILDAFAVALEALEAFGTGKLDSVVALGLFLAIGLDLGAGLGGGGGSGMAFIVGRV